MVLALALQSVDKRSYGALPCPYLWRRMEELKVPSEYMLAISRTQIGEYMLEVPREYMFVDASDVATDNVLMQLTEPKW